MSVHANLPVSLRGDQAPPFYSDSEMSSRIRELEWADTLLGPIASWPPELKNAVDIMLGAKEAISIYWGPDHLLLYNDAWREFIGDKHPDALGQPAREVFPELWEAIGPKLAHVLAGEGAAYEREQRLPLERDGRLEDTWFDYSFNPIPMADGSVGGVLNIGTEATERVKAESALRQSEEFHRLAAEAGNMGTWSVNLETGDAVLSPRMAELMGYAPNEHEAAPSHSAPGHWQQKVPRTAWMGSVHPEDRAVLEKTIDTARETKGPSDLEFRVQHDDGVRWLYARGEVNQEGPEEGPRLQGASIDITRRRELEEALVGTTEAVRRDIGRELHDVLSSDLAALAIKTDNLVGKLAQKDSSSGSIPPEETLPAELGDTLDEIAEGIRTATRRTRNLSHVLMPAALQEEHLAAALEHLCHEQGELGQPAPIFEGDRKETLPERNETAMHLYLIAREAMTNAQRHAKAEHIWVRLFQTKEALTLTIRDDGDGLPRQTDSQDGIGLRTMKHRADLIGASLQVTPLEEGGTLVRCALPLSRAKDK
ncbi:PAS domain S-box protein [Salinibacter sp. 10B]|uniref:PAS domain-containing sensor histidine kinase n=1 Tax=Salinibacter sp. 10B TaxID=1923971 RepID=UPI0015E3BC4E|nr:PAS domain S-box protein [Salinibacter sp. 10B]